MGDHVQKLKRKERRGPCHIYKSCINGKQSISPAPCRGRKSVYYNSIHEKKGCYI